MTKRKYTAIAVVIFFFVLMVPGRLLAQVLCSEESTHSKCQTCTCQRVGTDLIWMHENRFCSFTESGEKTNACSANVLPMPTLAVGPQLVVPTNTPVPASSIVVYNTVVPDVVYNVPTSSNTKRDIWDDLNAVIIAACAASLLGIVLTIISRRH
ncbi:hypothetical protein BH09PAT2_BH09PAT2_02840 [soil metagenome]